jgi:hypothetical protein
MALALGTAGVSATFAQTTTPSTSTPSTAPSADSTGSCYKHWHHHHDSVLSAAEKAQLKKAKEQALAANGTLQTEKENLKQKFEALRSANPPATKDQWTALQKEKEQFHQQLRSAELAFDPTLAPIFAKLDAAHQAHAGHHHSA